MAVILHDVAGRTAAHAAWGEALEAEGWRVVCPELPVVAPTATTAVAWAQAAARCEDHTLLAAAASALRDRDRPTVVVGSGVGATVALVLVAMHRLDGCVAVSPRLRYPTLGSTRPVQPIDLLATLDAPTQLHVAAADPELTPGHVDDLRQRLQRRRVPLQVCEVPGAGRSFLDPGAPHEYDPQASRLAIARSVRFVGRARLLRARSGSPR